MSANHKFIIVEDHDQEARTLQEVLLEFGFRPEDCLALVASETEARREIITSEAELALVFLDLSIPTSESDTRIDNEVGYGLLDWIQTDINQRGGRRIRVVIVSGQYDLTGTPDKKFRTGFEGTLLGVVHKENLRSDLSQVIAELDRDTLLGDLIRFEVDIIQEYQIVVDAGSSVADKCQAAKRLACKLVMNEGDHRAGRLGSCRRYADDLSGAIKQLIKDRFNDNVPDVRRVTKSNIRSGDSWSKFLWRGVMIEHLYGINNYRNRTEHLPDHDYSGAPGTADQWEVPHDVLTYFSHGDDVEEIIQLQVKALLRWYLPWHAQVYLPWAKSQASSTERRT
jgi:CheY-like chemotaxis protein